MSQTSGAHGLLDQAEIDGAVELFNEDIFHEFPIHATFGEAEVVEENKVVVEVLKNLRLLGKLEPERGPASEAILEQYSDKIVKHAFQQYKKKISGKSVRGLRMLGTDPGTMRGREKAAIELLRTIRGYRRLIARTLENVAIKMYTGQSFTIEVGGVFLTFDFKITFTDKSGTPWTGTGINVAKELDIIFRGYKRRNGRMPGLVILPDSWWADVIADNDIAKEVFFRFPELYRDGMPFDIAMNARFLSRRENPRFQVLTTDTQSEDSAGALTDLWPSNTLTLLDPDPGQENLKRTTLADENNDHMGGVGAYTFQKQDDRETVVVVNSSDAFIIRNERSVEAVQFKV